MSSPFDFGKSILQTKESLFTTEKLFNKDYLPFMVNRIMSNSERTVLFSECMDRYSNLDKKMQYDFYLDGIPKSRSFQKMWSKKEEDTTINTVHVEYICSTLNVSRRRGMELYKLIGPDVVQKEIDSRGGKTNGKQK